MATKSIKNTVLEVKQQGYSQLPGFHGNPLKFEQASREQVANGKVDDEYQRTISILKLNEYGECDLELLIPSIVSRRPIELSEIDREGDYYIDGQNKAVIFYNSGCEGGMPQMILEHDYDENISLQENYKAVKKKEAKLFQALNTLRKKLTKLDELRTEVCQEDELACAIENTMCSLDLVSDRFGSDKSTAKEVTVFSQFYYCLTGDYKDEGGIGSTLTQKYLRSGYLFWDKIFGHEAKVHGSAFRTLCLVDRFIDEALSNGCQTSFRNWCTTELKKQYTPTKLVKGFGTFESPRYALHRIIEKYNDMMVNTKEHNSVIIGPKKLVAAGELNKKFIHPDEDCWARIVNKSKKK